MLTIIWQAVISFLLMTSLIQQILKSSSKTRYYGIKEEFLPLNTVFILFAMDRIIAILLMVTSCLLMSSNSLHFKPTRREERLQQFIKLALPFLKPNFVDRPDLDSLYQILVPNGQDKDDKTDLKNTSKSKSNPFVCLNGNYFQVYQRFLKRTLRSI